MAATNSIRRKAIIVGAGIFGVTAALAMRRRGWSVELLDPGPLPHPLAASTDISKAIRLDYGPDETYMGLMEEALEGWRRWNADWPEPLFHETGVLFLRRSSMVSGSFEHESFALLTRRGHAPERLGTAAIRARFPAWNASVYGEGYFNPSGGYAESGRVVARLLEIARAEGVELRTGVNVVGLIERTDGRLAGVVASDGSRLEAVAVIVCAGAWTPHLLPWTRGFFRSTGMPVFHLRPADPDLFRPDRFPVFCADISATGYYGFPLGREGVVKVANHGPGRAMHPEAAERAVTTEESQALRAFLAGAIPSLADASIVGTRVCLYCDTWDGHLWIARDPSRKGLTIAAGDSGHAFKFAPLLGDWIADAAEGRQNPPLDRFRWRPEIHPPRSEEAARLQT